MSQTITSDSHMGGGWGGGAAGPGASLGCGCRVRACPPECALLRRPGARLAVRRQPRGGPRARLAELGCGAPGAAGLRAAGRRRLAAGSSLGPGVRGPALWSGVRRPRASVRACGSPSSRGACLLCGGPPPGPCPARPPGPRAPGPGAKLLRIPRPPGRRCRPYACPRSRSALWTSSLQLWLYASSSSGFQVVFRESRSPGRCACDACVRQGSSACSCSAAEIGRASCRERVSSPV